MLLREWPNTGPTAVALCDRRVTGCVSHKFPFQVSQLEKDFNSFHPKVSFLKTQLKELQTILIKCPSLGSGSLAQASKSQRTLQVTLEQSSLSTSQNYSAQMGPRNQTSETSLELTKETYQMKLTRCTKDQMKCTQVPTTKINLATPTTDENKLNTEQMNILLISTKNQTCFFILIVTLALFMQIYILSIVQCNQLDTLFLR
jgi:hypothetical protein